MTYYNQCIMLILLSVLVLLLYVFIQLLFFLYLFFFLIMFFFFFFFFFSSRRRHTRCSRDWSSDVCSSDLLHGWVGSWRYWITAMQATSTSYRAYALDLWGFGETTHNTLNYSLEQQASLLDRFLHEMGIGKIALVGHGLGALVGMTFATRFPQSVDRMMAVSCPLDYQAVNARLRTATPVELTEWLSNRSPEATTALSDASKVDAKAIGDSLVGLQANNVF